MIDEHSKQINIFKTEAEQQAEQQLSLFDINETTSYIKIKQIILFNSASYGYFQSDFDGNTLLEGSNNSGKTSFLNILQLIFLPENNLKDMKRKFEFKSGANGKTYSSSQTYKYYFPEERSYSIVEVENENHKFCVLMYGHKESDTEYRRMIIPLEYEAIKHLFFNETTQALVDISKTELFNRIKDLLAFENKSYEIIDSREKVIEHFYVFEHNKKRNIYYTIPIVDREKITIETFSLLFKTLFGVTDMNKAKVKTFIADRIRIKYYEKESNIKFDFKSKREEFKKLVNEEKLLTTLQARTNDFKFIQEHSLNNILLKKEIEKSIGTVSLIASYLISQNTETININQKELQKVQELLKIEEEDSRELTNSINGLKADKARLEGSLDGIFSQIDKLVPETMSFNDKIKYLSENKQSLIENYKQLSGVIDHDLEEVNKMIYMLEEQEKDVHRKEIDKKNNKELQNNLIRRIEQLKNSLKLVRLSEDKFFSENDRICLENLFGNQFLGNSIDSLEEKTLLIIKDLLSRAKIQDDILIIDNIHIHGITRAVATESIETINANIVKCQKELAELENIFALFGSEEKSNPLYEYRIKLSNLEKEDRDLSEKSSLIKNIEGNIEKYSGIEKNISHIDTELNNLNSQVEESDLTIAKFKSEIMTFKDTIYGLTAQIKSTQEIQSQLEELELNKKLFGKTLSQLQSKIDPSVIKESINIEELFKKTKGNISELNDKSTELILKMSRFVKTGLFDLAIDNEILEDLGQPINFDICFKYLENKYAYLNSEIEHLNSTISNIGSEINAEIRSLMTLKNDIVGIENTINSSFKQVKISDLGEIRFKIELKKDFLKILDLLKEGISTEELNYANQMTALSNYMEKNFGDSNEIVVDNLIESISYEVMVDGEFEAVSQSNGTETMINLIFLTFLFKGIYKSGYHLNLLIPFDESSKLDLSNTKSILNLVNNQGYTVVAATPTSTPEMKPMFYKTIIIDLDYLEYSFHPGRQQLISDNRTSNFTFEDVTDE